MRLGWMKTVVLGFLMAALVGCGRQGPDEASSSELQAVRDAHYVLELVPAGDEHYQFVTCHLDANKQPLSDSDQSGCTNAFVDAAGEGVVFPRVAVNSTAIWLEDPQSEQGKAIKKKLLVVNVVGGVQTAAVGAVGVAGALAFKKLFDVAFPLSVAAAVAAGGLLFINESQMGIIGLYKDSMKSGAQKYLVTTAKGVGNVALSVTEGLVDVLGGDDDQRRASDLQIVAWGEASRTLATQWDHIVDVDSPWSKPVAARIPNVLPILGVFLTDLGWVKADAIVHHCLPRHHDAEHGTVAMCLPLKENWSTGGMLRYLKPTQS